MNKKQVMCSLAGGALILGSALLFTACEIDSAETSSRNVGINIAGFYAHPSGGHLVGDNTGNPIHTMDLRQSGDELEGVDNNGNIFKGTIGQVDNNIATINLSGMTTAGQDGTISGNVEVGDTGSTGEGNATMRGTWIEPTLTATVYGTAVVPTNQPDDEVSGNVTLSASASTINVGDSVTLTATGASSYNWSSSGASGSFADSSPSDGNNSWTASGDGTATLTATDSADGSDSASVTVTVNP